MCNSICVNKVCVRTCLLTNSIYKLINVQRLCENLFFSLFEVNLTTYKIIGNLRII